MLSNKQGSRLRFYTFGFIVFSLVVFLFIYGIRENINLFLSPTEAINKYQIANDLDIKLGALVKKGSVYRDQEYKLNFIATDEKTDIKVTFSGVVPDLFREGQGVVMLGRLKNDIFVASKIMAKHDEKYVRSSS